MIKALEEDPEIFDYDGQYDMMQEQKRKADPRLVKKDRDVSCMPGLRVVKLFQLVLGKCVKKG